MCNEFPFIVCIFLFGARVELLPPDQLKCHESSLMEVPGRMLWSRGLMSDQEGRGPGFSPAWSLQLLGPVLSDHLFIIIKCFEDSVHHLWFMFLHWFSHKLRSNAIIWANSGNCHQWTILDLIDLINIWRLSMFWFLNCTTQDSGSWGLYCLHL